MKTDKIDLAAIADLLLAGRGVVAPPFADPVVTLTSWVAHRRRRSLTTHVDRCFPGLGATMWSVMVSKAGRLVITELADAIRVARLGPSRLRSLAANRDVRMTTRWPSGSSTPPASTPGWGSVRVQDRPSHTA